ncbi:hypothetical protein [Notoacmeibacter sp. MSK16QG-6]|uniref:hypothetical protein n=1 Tax=Notoacmeibacter sp. MSK16QG-6 TaxID=2957982 RepID=UPI0020A1B10B|nr:hypothetical protein [Notoacmeibacter sp. MSK16QG-6]MCP1200607.1 hypothetical protein [Notoacmeibacter sp. MSK16QG-6]
MPEHFQVKRLHSTARQSGPPSADEERAFAEADEERSTHDSEVGPQAVWEQQQQEIAEQNAIMQQEADRAAGPTPDEEDAFAVLHAEDSDDEFFDARSHLNDSEEVVSDAQDEPPELDGKSVPGSEDCQPVSGKSCISDGTYGKRANERVRLHIPPAGEYEAEHVVPADGRSRSEARKLAAYLEVKTLHRKHPGTGDRGTERVEAGWKSGGDFRADIRRALEDPVARAEGVTASNIYQLNQLGYGHVIESMKEKGEFIDPERLAIATGSYNHTVKHDPAIKLQDVTYHLQPRGQVEAYFARQSAITGRYPEAEQMKRYYDRLSRVSADETVHSVEPDHGDSTLGRARDSDLDGQLSETAADRRGLGSRDRSASRN